MWWHSKKEEETNPSTPDHTPSKRRAHKKKSSKQRPRLPFAKGKVSEDERSFTIESPVHVDETHAGIEVSFSDDLTAEFSLQSSTPLSAGSSLQMHLAQRKKVSRIQLNTTDWPLIEQQTKSNAGRQQHRVSLNGNTTNAQDQPDDVVSFLKNYSITDETVSVQDEINKLEREIKAMEQDRKEIERSSLQITPQPPADESAEWDTDRLLTKKDIPNNQRSKLQALRGVNLTLHLHSPKLSEAMASKCGSKTSFVQFISSITKSEPDAFVRIRPENCRDGGAALTIQSIALWKPSNGDLSFFISRDNGKAYHQGHLPDRLFRRMKNSGLDPKAHANNIAYLSTGPLGCYYAEFRSGECWWGSAVEDTDFRSICESWDVHRVAFGSVSSIEDSSGLKHFISSWIVVGRDGRLAWKNVPSRLHNLLYRRMGNEAAVGEIALGNGNTYFVRFLDGSMDYCLPASLSRVVHELEASGDELTSIYMNPELAQDFVVRSRTVS